MSSQRIHSVDDDVVYDRFEDEFWDAVMAAEKAPSHEAQREQLAAFFHLLDQRLLNEHVNYSAQVFACVSNLLYERTFAISIWEWLRHCAADLRDEDQRGQLCVTAFAHIPEPPINWDDLDQLLSLLAHE